MVYTELLDPVLRWGPDRVTPALGGAGDCRYRYNTSEIIRILNYMINVSHYHNLLQIVPFLFFL